MGKAAAYGYEVIISSDKSETRLMLNPNNNNARDVLYELATTMAWSLLAKGSLILLIIWHLPCSLDNSGLITTCK